MPKRSPNFPLLHVFQRYIHLKKEKQIRVFYVTFYLLVYRLQLDN